MSTFGLIHCGGFGAWCWDAVLPELQARGHRAAAVAMNIDSGEAKLVLLCPAWKRRGTAKTVKLGTVANGFGAAVDSPTVSGGMNAESLASSGNVPD